MNKFPKKVLAVFAHPDDEAFGPGGTLALWAQNGSEIHLLCATKGEVGQNATEDGNTAAVREKELQESAKALGIKKVEFLGFKDGEISNNNLQALEKAISKKIEEFKPDTILTFDINGVSGHLDHIAVASATTQSFKKTKIAQKLYYFTLIKAFAEQTIDYFIFFPPGKNIEEIDEIIDVSSVWEIKIAAMYKHQSQKRDVERILKSRANMPNVKAEHFLIRK